MSLLFRCTIKRHFSLMFLILAIGLGLFLLIEFFEKISVFVETDSSISTIFFYFFYKLPGIVAQILPAAFLLATVVLICRMVSSKELTALQAGGISLFSIVKILFFAAIFWALVQLVFSQILTTKGVEESERIWAEEVRKRNESNPFVSNIWFLEDPFVINLSFLRKNGEGEGFTAYQMAQNWDKIEQIIIAETFFAKENEWIIQDIKIFSLDKFTTNNMESLILNIPQNPESFFVTSRNTPQTLSLDKLGKTIKQLDASGSNIEALSTIWHSKFAYASTTIVMLFLAVAIVIWKSNLYLAIGISIPLAFLAYSVTIFCESLGYTGQLPPILSAWLTNIFIISLCSIWIFYMSKR